jgi:hypothetical protein
LYVVVAVLVLFPFTADWALATARLPNIDIQGSLSSPDVVADGKNSVEITIRVTENGAPRANDTLQTWIDVGGGLLLPQWAFTDDNGEAVIKFSPNPQTQYDTVQTAVLHIRDTSIGRLIEVSKDLTVEVPLTAPTEEKQSSIFG